ncbi:hypothetical protein M8494_04630 [Serratia ureilytica]
MRNNIWLIAVNLPLLALSMLASFYPYRQYIRPSETWRWNWRPSALNQGIVSSLPFRPAGLQLRQQCGDSNKNRRAPVAAPQSASPIWPNSITG